MDPFVAFSPQPIPLTGSLLSISGPGTTSNRVVLSASFDLSSEDRVQTVHFDIDSSAFDPTTIVGGTGRCSAVFSSTGSSLPDQPLLVDVTPTLANLAEQLAADAATAYQDRHGSTPTLLPPTVEADLQPLIDALVSGECQTSAELQNTVAGAYGAGLQGFDANGPLSNGSMRESTSRSFGAELSDGAAIGDAQALFSYFTNKRKFYAEVDDGGFVAGRWKRVAGRNGVFYGVNGTCDGVNDAATALTDWFDGPLP